MYLHCWVLRTNDEIESQLEIRELKVDGEQRQKADIIHHCKSYMILQKIILV